MALRAAKRALGLKDSDHGLNNNAYYDREALLHKVQTLTCEKEALQKEDKRLAAQLQELERETMELNRRVKHASRGAPLADMELIAALEQAKASRQAAAAGGKGSEQQRKLQAQELEMELDLQVKQLQRSEDKLASEAREWEARAKQRLDRVTRLEHKLSSYPKRFLQTVETLSQEVEALRKERDALERESQKDRTWLYESIHASKTKLALLSTELEGVEEELKEVEGDRTYWEAKLLQETVKSDLLMERRKALLAKLQGTQVLGKMVHDRVMLTLQERPQEVTLVEAVVEHLSPFLEPDVVVDKPTVEDALRSVLGDRYREGACPDMNQEDFSALLKTLRWDMQE